MPPAPGRSDPDGLPRGRSRFLLVLVVLLLLVLIALGGFPAVKAWQAWREWRAAEAAIQKHQFEEATAHLTAYLEVWPNSAVGHFKAAQTARRMGAYDQADAHLSRCHQLGWDAESLKQERFLIRAQQGDLSPEVEKYLVPRTRPELNNPDAPLILEALAKGYLGIYRLSPAKHALDLLLALEPDNVDMLLWHAWIQGIRFDREGALADYQHAVECAPENDEARLRLAEALLATGQARQAAPHLRQLAERLPDQPIVLLTLAKYCQDQGQGEEARLLLDRIVNDPHLGEIVMLRLQGQRRLPSTLSPATQAWLQKAIQLASPESRHPNHLVALYATALNDRADLALRKGETELAEKSLRAGLKISPSDPQVHFLLAKCLDRKGQTEEATKHRNTWLALKTRRKRLDEVGQKVAVSPRNPELRCEAAQILFELGQEEEALRWLDSLLREDAQFSLPQETLRQLQAYYDRSDDPGALRLLAAFRAAP